MSLKEDLRGKAKSVAVLALIGFERFRSGAVYTPFGANYWSNPYPMYRLLQRRDPMHYSLLSKAWVASRYDDVAAALRDPRFLVDKRKLETGQNGAAEHAGFIPSMLTVDPPDHTRLRTLASDAFARRAIEAMRPRIEQIVHQQLDAVAPASGMDFVQDLAVPLPLLVIAELLGIPSDDREQLKRWSDEMVRGIGYPGGEQVRRSERALHELTAHLEGIVEQRRKDPGDDLISALLQVEEAGDGLTKQEVLSTCQLLLNAGHAMSSAFLANALTALLLHPEQLDLLRRDPTLLDGAIEELLRYDGPAQATCRLVVEDVQLGEKTVQAGQQVIALLGAANRDPERFADADELDITRRDNHHLAFGLGVHYCLGAPLARLEATIALGAMLERFPRLRLATEDLAWERHMSVRGVAALPVTF